MQGYRHRPAHQSRGGATPLRRHGVLDTRRYQLASASCGVAQGIAFGRLIALRHELFRTVATAGRTLELEDIRHGTAMPALPGQRRNRVPVPWVGRARTVSSTDTCPRRRHVECSHPLTNLSPARKTCGRCLRVGSCKHATNGDCHGLLGRRLESEPRRSHSPPAPRSTRTYWIHAVTS